MTDTLKSAADMPEMVSLPRDEWEKQEKRAKKLAREKSYLQLLVNMMQQLGMVAGLENVVDAIPRVVMENIGGTNLILYYFIDQDIYRADLYGNRAKLDAIDDPDVVRVMASRELLEIESDISNSRMLIEMDTLQAWSWVYPLQVGNELIGVFRIENLHISTREWGRYLPTFFNYAALVLKNEILGYTRLQRAYAKLETEISARLQAEEDLRAINEELRLKLDTLLLPDAPIEDTDLRNILNVPELHALMDELYKVSGVASAIVDLKGEVLVGVGWQTICTQFHRVHPETRQNCQESDLLLTRGVPEGQYKAYRCKNNLWDVATPIFIGRRHVANIFVGQFFYEDDPPDPALFAAQADKYGFDKDAYLEAMGRVPLCSREKVDSLMSFYGKFAAQVSKLSFSNLKLARSLLENRRIEKELLAAKEGLEQTVAERTSALKNTTEELRVLNDSLEQRVQEEVAKNREKDALLIQQSRLASMGEMLHNVAHQWRQPLSALALILQNIKDDYDFGELDDATLDKQVSQGVRLTQKMSATIDDFRDFFRPDHMMESFSLAEAVREALNLVEASFENNQIKVVVEAGAEEVLVTGFANEYAQVLLNVLNNAKDAIKGRNVAGAIGIHICREGDQGVVRVRDNGGGIPADVLPQIFDPYYTTKEQGTGIGLYMSRMIMEHMHGHIEARNVEDGAEIAIAAPLA